ncbi:MAG: hypothetical protein IJ290_05080 [Bacteroidaceae bacterium]|nr:hypothetical protein [Bacteroidaceae bacterium]
MSIKKNCYICTDESKDSSRHFGIAQSLSNHHLEQERAKKNIHWVCALGADFPLYIRLVVSLRAYGDSLRFLFAAFACKQGNSANNNKKEKVMKKNLFKAIACVVFILFPLSSFAQNESAAKTLKPEFTARLNLGLYNSGAVLSGGVRLDDKHTVGLMVGPHETYYDDFPANVRSITTSVFARRYFHLGQRKTFAIYSDLSIGAGWIYEVDGKYWIEPTPDGNYEREMIDEEPGDAYFVLSWQPGIRVRCYKNLHIFLGPTIATNCLGVHLGIGF